MSCSPQYGTKLQLTLFLFSHPYVGFCPFVFLVVVNYVGLINQVNAAVMNYPRGIEIIVSFK